MARKDGKEDVNSDKKMIKKELEEYSADESPESGSSVSFSPTPEPKRTKAGRSTRSRPKKRNLIRWNEVYDQRCLLALQHVLSIKGVKIPWDEVGAKLGPTITEGAIVQHLAKLRNKLENEGVKVTPALQRGGRIRIGHAPAANNVKTVSAKGAVAKRAGNAKAFNSKYSRTDDDKNKFKPGCKIPRKDEAKAGDKNEKAADNPKSGQAGLKTEVYSGNNLKNLGEHGGGVSYNNDDAETIGSNDTTQYSSESEEGHEQDAVAIGAPFLELISSKQSSAASSGVQSPARSMVIIPPRSLVVILLIGRTMAQCLAQSEENNCIEEMSHLRGRSFSQDGYVTRSGSLGNQPFWTPSQATEGAMDVYNEYDAEGSPALGQDNSHLTISSALGPGNRESIVPNAQSNFAGYGMQSGLFDHDTGALISPQRGFQFQYRGAYDQGNSLVDDPLNEIGTETTTSGYGYSLDNSVRYANDSNAEAPSADVCGYPFGNNHGFPISNERSTSRTMAPGNVSGYSSSSGAHPINIDRGNIVSNSPFNFGHNAINEDVAGLNVDQFMGSVNPLEYSLNRNNASNWGSFDHPDYSL